MEELVKLVVEKTGISEEQARAAVLTVIQFLKDRLPEPVDTLLDNFMKQEDGISDLISGISSLFGK